MKLTVKKVRRCDDPRPEMDESVGERRLQLSSDRSSLERE